MYGLASISGHSLSPPIAWMGGKRSILHEILNRFPLQFDRYIEVFGGSGVVLFGKKPSAFEVWNDMNGDLYNFYYCVKNKHLELLQNPNFLPLNSRMEFGLLKAFLKQDSPPAEDMGGELAIARQHFSEPDVSEIEAILTRNCELGDVHRAAAFFKLNHMSYGAGMTSYSCQPCNLRRFYSHITRASNRLAEVILESKDFEQVIKTCDRPNSFFYLDPPYYMAEGCYAVDFPREDHHRLHEALTKVEGMWLLSYNDQPFIWELYKDYPQYSFTRINNLVQRYEGGAEYSELLIANYDMEERGSQNEQLSLMDE